MVQELIGAEAQQLCGAEYSEGSTERPTPTTATASGTGTPESARTACSDPSCR